MSEKIYVKNRDIHRVLHTELLPYEVPIIFSNEKLYRFSRSSFATEAPELIRKLFDKQLDYTIAFEYTIWQGNGHRRTLSLIHPGWQLKFPELYRDFSELILSLCRRSSYSLRYPSRVASYYFERDFKAEDDGLKSETADQEPEAFGEQSVHAATYFYYARYAQLYRFIDSHDFLALEARFCNLLKFDIKRCFPSIYTHSLSWAVKDKDFAKANIHGLSFDSIFDKLMQGSNYNETNGIVVGPEASRIFAEIILQRVDLNISLTLKDEGISEKDFAIRRYVDDYFIFARTENLCEKIKEICERCLLEYKLYINDSKTEKSTVPFATPQTIAKTDVKTVLKVTLLKWLNHLRETVKADATENHLEVGERLQLRTPYRVSTRIIRDIKIAVARSGTSYDVVTGYALGSITRSLYRLQNATRAHPIAKTITADVQNILLVAIETAFHLYSMDFRVRTTYFISQFMLLIERITRFNEQLHSLVVIKMHSHVLTIIDGLPRHPTVGVEILNLLIATKALLPTELLSSDYLFRLTSQSQTASPASQSSSLSEYTYFDFMGMFYYVGNSVDHLDFRNALEAELVKRFETARDILRSAEMTFLLLDVIACPYIAVSTKRTAIRLTYQNVLRRVPNDDQISQILNYSRRSLGFINWHADVELEKLLWRKQLNPAY